MLASSGETPPGDGWVAEVKWDGFRIVATVADGRLSLRSRPLLLSPIAPNDDFFHLSNAVSSGPPGTG
jgi:hypothetical protein